MSVPPSTASPDPRRRLAAVLFSDVQGFSGAMRSDEDATIELLAVHDRLLDEEVERYGGRKVKDVGDAYMVEFGSVVAAVACALDIQRRIGRHNQDASAGHELHVRIGVHFGEVVVRPRADQDLLGDVVNVAQRLEAEAPVGQVCVSDKVLAEVRGKVRATATPLGFRKLKNVGEMELYALQPRSERLADRPWTGGNERTRVTIARLPVTGEHFFGRGELLQRLDAAWEDRDVRVLSLVAVGGAGKSTLVNRWLGGLAEDGWRGAECVVGWSFYSQGTSGTGASGDAFVDFALRWLGYEGEEITSPWERGEALARLVRGRRTLLVLDGLEPLQQAPGAQTGRLQDPPVAALVRELAAQNQGLCVITTRLPVADIAGRPGTEEIDLEDLSPSDGAALLRALGVEGSERELRRAAEEYGGHCLALTLLGTYLRDALDGDVRRRREVPLLDEEIEQGGHARRVMASYASWLGGGPEVRILRLIGLFDRPAESAALAALRGEPAIPDLTAGIEAGAEASWRKAVARLRKARLIAERGAGSGLDAHPLLRTYFGERLREAHPEAWCAGHQRLYEHYRRAAPEYPATLGDMMPLYAAVVHGCRAGRPQEAMYEVYWRRILRQKEHYSWKKLGAFGAELTALAAFFDRPWEQPSPALAPEAQAWVLNEAAFVLRALGRLPEAIAPMRAGLEARIRQEDWKNAAISATNLSELTLTLGDLSEALAWAEQSVELADRSGDAFQRMSKRTTLADVLHQAGRWEESAASFAEAEAMQAEQRPDSPRLYSVRGYLYCDLLVDRDPPDREACREVLERAGQALAMALEGAGNLLEIGLNHLALGRAHLGLGLTASHEDERASSLASAAEHLDRAVEGLRQAGQQDDLPRGLVTRAALHRVRGDASSAAADLGEAREIAERGSMLLHECDVHLEWARLALGAKEVESARGHLERTRAIVAATGYQRREAEIGVLEAALVMA